MSVMAVRLTDPDAQTTAAIPALTHHEAGWLARTEYRRVLAVLEQLSGDDWEQPTYCTKWTVRDMVAHLAGSCAGSAGWGEFWRQMLANPYLRQESEPADAINRRQLEDRHGRTPSVLVDEFRQAGAKAMRVRSRLPWPVRQIPVPMGEMMGWSPLHYLMDTIYPRDQWMHRVDLCAATGKPFVATPEHDGRIVALVVRELGQNLAKAGHRVAVELELTGAVTDRYRLGTDAPQCRVVVDAIDFNLLCSGRITADEVTSRVEVEGDREHARTFLSAAKVLY